MKKLMLITYYWPPCGGSSVLRWVKFAAILPKYGWEVTVVTTKSGDYPVYDYSLEKEIPPEIKIIRTFVPKISSLVSLLRKKGTMPHGTLEVSKNDSFLKKLGIWVRLNLIIPDLRVVWNFFAYRAIKKELETNIYDAIITTGPPHSTHLLGLKVKNHFGVQWIADFRDPWTKIFYLENQKINFLTKYINSHLEKKVLQTADFVTVISDYIAEELPKGNKIVINNGFNPDVYQDMIYHKTESFRIKYVGKLTQGQDIDFVLDVLDRLVYEDGLEHLVFTFVGTFTELPEKYSRYQHLKFEVLPYLPFKEAAQQLIDSEILILLINYYAGNKGMLTMKLFDYLGSGTFILGVGPQDGDAAKLINRFEGGTMIGYRDITAFKKTVQQKYQEWENDSLTKNTKDLKPLTTAAQLELILKYIAE